MSNLVSTLVQQRRVGSGVKKAVLMYFADRASDDGSGIWSSKASISKDTEISIRAVQGAIKELCGAGLISEVGNKACKNGYTIEYRLNLGTIEALDDTRAPAAPLPPQELHPTPAPAGPLPPQELHPNHPLTIHEPSLLKVKFDLFWGIWPNKVAKPKAKSAWDKLSAEDHRVIMALPRGGFDAWQSAAPHGTNPVHPASFLNGRRWEDAPILNIGGNNGNGNYNGRASNQGAGDSFDEAKDRALRLAGLR